MIPVDSVSFYEQLQPFCVDCGSGQITKDAEQPFFEDMLLVVPLKCNKCSYSFSLQIEIAGRGIVKES